MIGRALLAVAIVAALAGVGALTGFATGLAEPDDGARINVTATRTYFTGRAEPPFGRIGNVQGERWRITDRHGRRIGRMLQTCRWIVARARYCSGEVELPLGKLTYQGTSATTFEGEYALTGGTGRYRSGGGVMIFQAIGLRKNILLITIDR